MKLHIPTGIRTSLLACISLAALGTPTMADTLDIASGGSATLVSGSSYDITHAGNAQLNIAGDVTISSISGAQTLSDADAQRVTLDGAGTVTATPNSAYTGYQVNSNVTLKLDGTHDGVKLSSIHLNGGSLDMNGYSTEYNTVTFNGSGTVHVGAADASSTIYSIGGTGDMTKTGDGELIVKTSEAAGSGLLSVAAGTLTLGGGWHTFDNSVSLHGSELRMQHAYLGSASSTNNITLVSDSADTPSTNTISSSTATSIYASVSGTGNLVLENDAAQGYCMFFYNSMDFSGDMNLAKGDFEICNENDATVTSIRNSGDINIENAYLTVATPYWHEGEEKVSLANGGDINIKSGGSLVVTYGTIENEGVINVFQDGRLAIQYNSSINSEIRMLSITESGEDEVATVCATINGKTPGNAPTYNENTHIWGSYAMGGSYNAQACIDDAEVTVKEEQSYQFTYLTLTNSIINVEGELSMGHTLLATQEGTQASTLHVKSTGKVTAAYDDIVFYSDDNTIEVNAELLTVQADPEYTLMSTDQLSGLCFGSEGALFTLTALSQNMQDVLNAGGSIALTFTGLGAYDGIATVAEGDIVRYFAMADSLPYTISAVGTTDDGSGMVVYLRNGATAAIPEPTTATLSLLALAALAARRRRH